MITNITFAGIDYSYRPVSYWEIKTLRQLVANIKGAERKKTALRLLEQGRLQEADPVILTDCLSDASRDRAGKVHPALMGGEYLPDYRAGEVEIARVAMDSITRDVISIRAFPKRERIGLRAVDEYNSTIKITPTCAKRPLNLRQLIRLIDTGASLEMGPVGLGIMQVNFDCSGQAAESFADFLEFSSEFYSDLGKHYRLAIDAWVERKAVR